MRLFQKIVSENFDPARDLQRPRTYVAHNDVTYPIYWNNYQKCVILGKSSKHVCFIFISYLSQKPDLSGGGDRTTTCFADYLPAYYWRLFGLQGTVSDNITMFAPCVIAPIRQSVGQYQTLTSLEICFRSASQAAVYVVSTYEFSTCSN